MEKDIEQIYFWMFFNIESVLVLVCCLLARTKWFYSFCCLSGFSKAGNVAWRTGMLEIEITSCKVQWQSGLWTALHFYKLHWADALIQSEFRLEGKSNLIGCRCCHLEPEVPVLFVCLFLGQSGLRSSVVTAPPTEEFLPHCGGRIILIKFIDLLGKFVFDPSYSFPFYQNEYNEVILLLQQR